jgi:hypothetical protein
VITAAAQIEAAMIARRFARERLGVGLGAGGGGVAVVVTGAGSGPAEDFAGRGVFGARSTPNRR